MAAQDLEDRDEKAVPGGIPGGTQWPTTSAGADCPRQKSRSMIVTQPQAPAVPTSTTGRKSVGGLSSAGVNIARTFTGTIPGLPLPTLPEVSHPFPGGREPRRPVNRALPSGKGARPD